MIEGGVEALVAWQYNTIEWKRGNNNKDIIICLYTIILLFNEVLYSALYRMLLNRRKKAPFKWGVVLCVVLLIAWSKPNNIEKV